MEVAVYADLLFLINAGMDGLCLLLTGRMLHRRVKGWRVILSSVLGGVYAVVALLPDFGTGPSLLLDMAICLAMCGLVFGSKSSGGRRGLPAAMGVYFLLSMALGGIMTALYHLLNRGGWAEHLAFLTEGGGDGLGSWLFLLLALVGGGISLWGGRLGRRAGRVAFCAVTVEIGGKTATLRGMVDSGNLLRDPMGGRAVICAEKKALAELLSPPLMAVMEGMPPQAVSLSPSDAKRIRVIPADTATGGGILYGFFPDRVMLTAEDGGAAREVDAVVAVTSIPTNGVAALIPADLI
jgi:stage II sporulation protein GA (sporulation sigma-E factor processing peptidase)